MNIEDVAVRRIVRETIVSRVGPEDGPTRVGDVIELETAPAWADLQTGTWSTRAWLRGFISAGGCLPEDEFDRLWGE